MFIITYFIWLQPRVATKARRKADLQTGLENVSSVEL